MKKRLKNGVVVIAVISLLTSGLLPGVVSGSQVEEIPEKEEVVLEEKALPNTEENIVVKVQNSNYLRSLFLHGCQMSNCKKQWQRY